jgi:hypothetical protein
MHRQRTGSGRQWLVWASLLMSAFIIRGNAEAAATYVGEAVCGSGCHLGKHEGWVQTAHQQILMDGASEASYINDGNQSGRSEFFDGGRFPITSLPGGDAFAAFGASAPILGRNVTLGPYVQIGTAKYPIAYTLGGSAVQSPTVADADNNGRILNGEAQWKQLYITKIGPSHYVLPVQFNAKTSEYVPYNTSEWYDQANVPIAKTALRIAATSYERRCAGCHSTGVKIGVNPTSGLWTMSYSDMNVACEACHGPGSDHVYNAPTVELKKATIVNPATLVARKDLNGDGNRNIIDNLIAQNAVCYQCHQSGTGLFGTGDGALLYPSKAAANGNPVLYRPGQDLRDYFAITQNKSDYWGAHDENRNGVIDVGAEEFIAAASSNQQGQEHANGPHAADKAYDHPCFVCHDMHDTSLPHMIATEVEGVPNTGRNTLCLACHATHGDFAGLTQDEVTGDPSKVALTVRAHVKNRAFMDVGFETRCVSCHMPPTGKSAIEPAIAIGRSGPESVRGGDLRSHTFEPIWPGFVQQPADFSWTDFLLIGNVQVGPIPDSCTSCHAHDPASGEDNIVTQWVNSGHADGYGEPFNHWNATGEVEIGCARCHSQAGFKQLADSSDANGIPAYTLNAFGTNPIFTAVTAQSAIYPKVLNCNTCHEENGGGETVFGAGKIQQVVFPSGAIKTLGDSSNICMQCHQGRESGLSVVNATFPRSFINRHYFAEAAIYFGTEVTASYEYQGNTYLGKNQFAGHEQIERQTCIHCHLNTTNQETGGIKKDHDFFPNVEDCSSCHDNEQGGPLENCPDKDAEGNTLPFKCLGRPSFYTNVDYDGDGIAESFRHEVDGMQATLLVDMNVYAKANGYTAVMYTPGVYPYWAKASCYLSDPGCTPVSTGSYSFPNRSLLGAAFNYHSAQDPGAGIHNHKYVIQTLYDSIGDLGGSTAGMTRP